MRSNNKFWKILWIFALSLILSVVLSFSRLVNDLTLFGLPNVSFNVFVFAVAYFIITILLLKRYGAILPVWLIISAILLGSVAMEIYPRFIRPDGFMKSLGALPDFIIRIPAIFVGLWYFKMSTQTSKVIVACLFGLFILWCSLYGGDLWIDYVYDPIQMKF